MTTIERLRKDAQRYQSELRWLEHEYECADNATARMKLKRRVDLARQKYERANEQLRLEQVSRPER